VRESFLKRFVKNKKEMARESPKSRTWCGTLNNYTADELNVARNVVNAFGPTVKYFMFGHEGALEGTPHLQMFIKYFNQVRMTTLKRVLPRAHWEICKGSFTQNTDYCKKEGDWEEYGIPDVCTIKEASARGGAKTKENWDLMKVSAREGDLDEIPAEYYIKYYRTFKEIARDHMSKPADLDGVCGIWYWGASGTGKSRAARAEFPDHYLKCVNKWWDGYQNEENVIIDDFGKTHEKLGYHLKIWADRYSFPAEVKGSTICIRPKKIIVTSNYKPSQIWEDENTLQPILRRFKVVKFITLLDHISLNDNTDNIRVNDV